jgi:Protein of unknown function (DUF3540)
MNVVPLRVAPDASSPVHSIGTVRSLLADGQFAIEDEAGGLRTCRRAASCLLKPQLGDTVLVSGPDAYRVFLIAVLEQADAAVSRIEVDGALVLGGNAHPVAIESEGEVRLRSGTRLAMSAEQWSMRAGSADCRTDALRLTAKEVEATTGTAKLFGKVFETVADRIVQMARNTLRIVDEMDQSRVRHLDCKASETVRIHGRHTTVTGQDLVKVDAAQIHMG